jgi:N4-gp56 family major capsid protein
MPSTKNVVTTDRIDHPVNIVFDKKFLKTLEGRLVYDKFAQKSSVPQHAGDTRKWRRYAELAVATTPLDEVQDPDPVLPQKTDLSVILRQYGAWLKTSAWRDMTGLTQDKAAMTMRLSRQAARTIDTLCKNVCAGGASNTTCSNGSPTSTLLNSTDIRTVIKNLMGENAEMMAPRIKGTAQVGTSPIRDAFIVIAHTDLVMDIEDVSGFKSVANYPKGAAIYPGECGSIGNSRWLLTTEAYTSGSNYYCLFLAEDAFGSVRIRGGDRALIYHSPAQVGSPLEMYGTLGWKRNYASRILYDVLLHSLICTTNY